MTPAHNHAAVAIADDIFLTLIGESRGTYSDPDQIRSVPASDSVDIYRDGQWYRITPVPIDRPISEEESA